MRSIGFAFAAAAALGNGCIDGSRKYASQRLTATELTGLLGLLNAILLIAIVMGYENNISFDTMFVVSDISFLRIVVASAGIKVLAGFLYQRALHLSPLSVTVPYLAFSPVLLVFTSFIMMHEQPSYQGLLGVVVVTIGGYLLALEQPKHIIAAPERQVPPGSSSVAGTKSLHSRMMLADRNVLNRIIEPFLALKREQGSLLMLGVAGLLSVTNSLDKMGTQLAPSPIVFAAIQKVIMAIPVTLFLGLNSPSSFSHLFGQFHVLISIALFEVLTFVCFLQSLETLLVAYSIALKRSSVLITVFIGSLVFKEKILRRLPFIVLMVGGMVLIVLA